MPLLYNSINIFIISMNNNIDNNLVFEVDIDSNIILNNQTNIEDENSIYDNFDDFMVESSLTKLSKIIN